MTDKEYKATAHILSSIRNEINKSLFFQAHGTLLHTFKVDLPTLIDVVKIKSQQAQPQSCLLDGFKTCQVEIL